MRNTNSTPSLQTKRSYTSTKVDNNAPITTTEHPKGISSFQSGHHQGSITALTDSEGNIVESFLYDEAYGTILDHYKTVESYNPYCYTGRELDSQDLYYYRARYYDPSVGRFISSDPIEFLAGDTNFYRYVGGDPVNFVDPSGFKAYSSDPACMKIAMGTYNSKAAEEQAKAFDKKIEAFLTPILSAAAFIWEWSPAGLEKKAIKKLVTSPSKCKVKKKEKAASREKGLKSEAEKRCGGSHRNMKKPRNDGLDSHHAPDRLADPDVSVLDGSAIKMDPTDHKLTSSNGRSNEARDYAKETKKMIAEGKKRDAMAREVKDIRNAAHKGSGNRKKYNQCIKEMLEYAKKMGHLPPKKK